MHSGGGVSKTRERKSDSAKSDEATSGAAKPKAPAAGGDGERRSRGSRRSRGRSRTGIDGSHRRRRAAGKLQARGHRDIERSAVDRPRHQAGPGRGRGGEGLRGGARGQRVVLNSSVESGSTGADRGVVLAADPERQARRRARRLLADRRSALAPRRDQRHHQADRRCDRRTTRFERLDRRTVEGARQRRNGSRTGIGRSAAARRAPPPRLDPRLARTPPQARLDVGSVAADRHRPRRRRRPAEQGTTAAGASATPSTTPATSSPSPPASLLIGARDPRPDRADRPALLVAQPLPRPPPARARPRLTRASAS